MKYFAGLDVPLEETAICVVDEAGAIVKEMRTTSEPKALAASLRLFSEAGLGPERKISNLSVSGEINAIVLESHVSQGDWNYNIQPKYPVPKR